MGHKICFYTAIILENSVHTGGKMTQQGSVLIVDDELGPRESLRMILKPLYEVKTASTGNEALRHLQEGKIDLITLDLKMPGLSGMDVLREIKRMKVDVAVIIITAYGTLTNAHEAIRYGAIDFISKPYNATDILSVVRRTVEQRQYHSKMKGLMESFEGVGGMEGKKTEIEKFLNN
jgi:putative two-component system response regulator